MALVGRAFGGWLVVTLAACGSSAERGARDAGVQDAAVPPVDAGSRPPRECKRYSALREPYFGDLHVHTALSLDANLQGTRLRPVEAYRFARGERVGLPPYDDAGKPRRTYALERPLDFVALSDHAEFLGLVNACQDAASQAYDSPECQKYRSDPDAAFFQLNAAVASSQGEANGVGPCTRENAFCGSAAKSAWREAREAAATQNDDSDRCTFTTFVAYEWSASPGLLNLHRNVIFASDQVPELPFSYFDGNQEEELWRALTRDCLDAASGCDVLTIPHNSNLSAGLMFEPLDQKGAPIDARYAAQRAAFEPLVEIIQHKGASECLPAMGNDEQCDFELLPYASLGAVALGMPEEEPTPRDFVRQVLAEGLALEETLGVDPFRFGFVGGTDSHLAIPGAVEESSFQGHGGAGSSARTVLPVGLSDHVFLNPGGLAVLWAEENSRSALFAAMRRREAYATSGPRIVLRFFGGFDYPGDLCASADPVQVGYGGGVPMGGELTPRGDTPPTFAVWAMRDPGTEAHPGAPLAKLQIIKGWVEDGTPHFAVYDVAGPAEPAGGVDARCAPTGKGDDELCATWRDPDHVPGRAAFYYARVLENPTCRWQAHVCRAAKVDCAAGDPPEGYEGCCAGEPETHQERAWSSPIFLGTGQR